MLLIKRPIYKSIKSRKRSLVYFASYVIAHWSQVLKCYELFDSHDSTLARNDFLTHLALSLYHFAPPPPSPSVSVCSLQVRGCTCSFADLSLRIQIGFASADLASLYELPATRPGSCLAGWLLLLKSRSTRAVSCIVNLSAGDFSLFFADSRFTSE